MPDLPVDRDLEHLQLELEILSSEIEEEVSREQDGAEPEIPAPTLESASTRTCSL